jgi:hypothetical protein
MTRWLQIFGWYCFSDSPYWSGSWASCESYMTCMSANPVWTPLKVRTEFAQTGFERERYSELIIQCRRYITRRRESIRLEREYPERFTASVFSNPEPRGHPVRER